MRFFTVFDEIGALSFKEIPKPKRDQWFREYLREVGLSEAGFGKPLEEITFPQEIMDAEHFPRDADLTTRAHRIPGRQVRSVVVNPAAPTGIRWRPRRPSRHEVANSPDQSRLFQRLGPATPRDEL